MKTKSLIDVVRRFPECRTAVVGDLMLDRYIWGDATRISQEAPVPVVTVNRESEAPGGAANVATNIRTLGGQAAVYGIIGDDTCGRRLRAILENQKADVSGIVTVEGHMTTAKTRVIANHQQVVRIDHEDTSPVEDKLLSTLKQTLLRDADEKRWDAIIFEDYAKGLLTAEFIQDVVDSLKARNVITVLDPHPSHAFNLQGLTLLTPNRAEAFALAGKYYQPGIVPIADDTPLVEVGKRLRRNWEVTHLLITLGSQGMALFHDREELPFHIPTRAIDVYDVSGAGDTVTATFVLAMLAGAAPTAAAELANHAAGIVVGKVGTLPVHAKELMEQLKDVDG